MAKEHCDELVVVDTGSSDKSLDILSQSGVTPYHFTWTDDFSAARNFSLGLCQAQFILVLDIDERITSQGFATIRASLEKSAADLVYLPIHNLQSLDWEKDQRVSDTQMNLRILRNGRGLQFVNAIHEVLDDTDPSLQVVLLEVPIFHLGYAQDLRAIKESRNRKILAEGYRRNPSDPFFAYYHAVIHSDQDQRPLLYQVLPLAKDNLRYQILREILHQELIRTNTSAVESAVSLLLQMKPDCIDVWLYRGLESLRHGQVSHAEDALKKAYLGLDTEVNLNQAQILEVSSNYALALAMGQKISEACLIYRSLMQKVNLSAQAAFFGFKLAFAAKDKDMFTRVLNSVEGTEISRLDKAQRAEIAIWMQQLLGQPRL